jgi:hypothetical protein
MARFRFAAVLSATVFLGAPHSPAVRAQESADLSGRWTLNRQLSEFPREIGFSADWMTGGGGGGLPGSTASSGGGRGRRGSSGGGPIFPARSESADDARRLQLLTAEVRNPSAHLTVADTPPVVTITDDRGQPRTFHPTGKDEELELDGVSVGVTAKREAGHLVVLYSVEQGRSLRYTYSRATDQRQLIVEVEFLERSGGDKVRRVYEPTSATETAAPTGTAAPEAPTKPNASTQAAPDATRREPFNQKPDAELKGLSSLGVVVEDLSPQAAACGLKQDALETAVSKRLSSAGFTIRRNSDEDTYAYVSVMTTNTSTGLCISRYDVFLYTNTTARLSYQETPVLVQVSLLHKGGIAGGGPTTHADAVLRGVQEYLDQFATRIHDANK